MAATTNTEWDDIPTSSELFGGDFFGDELMEMYTADHGLNLGDNSASVITTSSASASQQGAAVAHHNLHQHHPVGSTEEDAIMAAHAAATIAAADDDDAAKHPGLLIAMNAAAMDGGLSPLGSDPEFVVPLAAPSDVDAAAATATALPPHPFASLPPAPATAAPPQQPSFPAPAAMPQPAPVVARAAAPVPAAVTSAPVPPTTTTAPAVAPAKRPAAAATVPARVPTKKYKTTTTTTAAPPPAAVAPRALVHARLAPSGGIKVGVPPLHAAARPLGHVVSSSSSCVPRPAATKAPARPPPVAPIKKPAYQVGVRTAVVPRNSVGGGINHQVVARPSAVASSSSVAVAAASHRNLPPASSSSLVSAPSKPGAVPSASSVVAGVKRAATEADFKDVASAAVSSLIQSASSTLKTATTAGGVVPKPAAAVPARTHGDPAKGGGPAAQAGVDTSTAHINALTSQNWVTACNPVPPPEAQSASSSSSTAAVCDKAARNARRATLTQEERAKQNRDRNREHARNTRLRKKAYVEELKRTLTELVAQRDAADLEKRHEAQRNREQREVRFRVMEEFLKLRGRNEPNAARWVAILEDGFAFTLPRTAFRRMVDAEKSVTDVNGTTSLGSSNSPYEQVLRGAAAVMEDSQHLSNFLQSVGGPASAATQVQMVYRCDRKRFFMDGNIAFMDFTAHTQGAVAKGAAREVVVRGSMKSSFSPASNKLITVDVTLDTASFVRQVEAAAGGDAAVSARPSPATADAAAAAAHEADALLDSLQMPQIFVDKKDVAVAHAAAAAVAGPVSVSSDDGERSTDESTTAPLHA
eukprot:CAMPEP_0181076734 /NCGR_PEP_ID=MMETSP1071-20121207/576_1 /TAXON_ID=35127 /ORGANISM="Thalassiosira sp., Strain NH16" /LENGTH=813 /DNA_ID=CAMNT_0023157933 /DNA_START=722 /DNA_END=3163 /DNA_ORIENTATION=-